MKDKKIFVSIIVPVYNVEPYLKKCIQSILEQSYSDYEVLLVDDGSTDSSRDICDHCGQLDSRIRVFHKDNGGLSDARNYGIDRAVGEYLTFVDSDDYLGRDYLKILVDLVVEYNAQISCVSALEVSENSIIKLDISDDRSCLNTEAALKCMCTKEHFGIAAWGKLYKAELFQNIRYPKGKLYEDILTTPHLIALSRSIAYSDSRQYFWVQRKGSITNTHHSKKTINQYLAALEALMDFIDDHYLGAHDAAVCRYVDDSFWQIVHKLAYDKGYSKNVRYLISRSKSYWKEGLKNPYVSRKRKSEIILTMVSPRLHRMVYRLWQLRSVKNVCR